MKFAKACLPILICAACSSVFAAADAKKELTVIYAGLSKAFVQKNIRAYDKVLTKDFTVIDLKGKTLSRAEILHDYTTQMKMMKNPSWTRKITRIAKKGSNFLVSVSSDIQADVSGGDGNKHHLRLIAAARDPWTKESGRWMLVKSKLEGTTSFLDGQPVGGR